MLVSHSNIISMSHVCLLLVTDSPPSQLLPSLVSWYPSKQVHLNDPGVFLHLCSQPCLPAEHSLISAVHDSNERGNQMWKLSAKRKVSLGLRFYRHSSFH